MIRRLLDACRGHAVFGALYTLTIKVSGSLAALAMFAVAARTLDVSSFGELVIVFNVVSLAAVVAVFGQDTLVQRSWGEYVERDPDLARGSIRFGLSVVGVGAASVATLFVVWARVLDGRLSDGEIAAVAAFLVTQTFLHFTANLGRVACGSIHSEPPRELVWRLPLVIGLAAVAATGGRTSILAFFAAAATGQAVGLAWLAVLIARRLPAPVRHARTRTATREWIGRSLTMAAAAMAEAAHQYADVVLIGRLLGADAAAGYFVVARIAAIFSMLTSGIHTYSASKVAKLFYLDRLDDLRRLMAQIAGLTAAIAILLFALVVLEGPLLLHVFGAGYGDFRVELVMMSLVTGFATLAGPGPMLMLLTGADLPYLKLVTTSLAVRLSALVLFAPTFGVRGAILAV
ncbi:MAG: oligosaccharide flippase family protein, partial [Phyllobacteriaceae bacterium]|nr:oligosaccharide flippase family protein [Phyllobacteriaceae bacterium]